MLGFPIRTPPDQRSVANSPGLIAGSNVLLRLLMPRHPPCALHSLSLTNTQQKQQTNNHTHASHTCNHRACLRYEDHAHTNTPTNRNKPIRPKRLQGVCILIKQDARVHYPTINSNTSRCRPARTTPSTPVGASGEGGRETITQLCCVIPQGPTVCQDQTRSRRLQVPRLFPKEQTVLRSTPGNQPVVHRRFH